MINSKNNNRNIIIVTGGTGGHIFPAITIGKYLNEKLFNVKFITDSRGLYNISLARFNPKVIPVRGFAGKTFFQKIILITLIFISFFRTIFFFKKKQSRFSFGVWFICTSTCNISSENFENKYNSS